MLEANLHSENAFLTLTYSDENLPINSQNFATLNPKHLQDWLKRFRKRIEPSRIRYFAVGEYGDETFRPHYHAALFGFKTCLYGRTRLFRPNGCCPQCDIVSSTWEKGQILLGTLETTSAQYISGYVTKKMTAPDDMRLLGRHPEFARMSLRPGIGADAMHDVASTILEFNLETSQTDVPSALRHGSRNLPLGRYLTRRLRVLTGKDPNAPQETLDKIQEELRPLRETAFNNSASFKKTFVEANAQKVLNMETKTKIYKKVRKL